MTRQESFSGFDDNDVLCLKYKKMSQELEIENKTKNEHMTVIIE